MDQVVALTQWVGAGRKLTQTGRLTMADARELVPLLGTDDVTDRVRTSEDLDGINLVVAWAKAAGLVRVMQGKLVPTKKGARLLERPTELWAVLFEVFDRLGEMFTATRWSPSSLLGYDFPDGFRLFLHGLADGVGSIGLAEAEELVWSQLVRRYQMDDATPEQLERWRRVNDRDMRRMVDALASLGALVVDEDTVRLTELASTVLRRPYGDGTAIAQIRVTLTDSEPAIWRRVLVPATIRLDRLDHVIQAAMGWTNSHLHMFTKGEDSYGVPDPDFPLLDERKVTLRDLGEEFEYEYDFGDGWTHTVVVEAVVKRSADVTYPACVAGERACPPEDVGGIGGYEELIEVLADPRDPEYEHMVAWMGLEKGSDFDPSRFDANEANRRLDAVTLGAFRSA